MLVMLKTHLNKEFLFDSSFNKNLSLSS